MILVDNPRRDLDVEWCALRLQDNHIAESRRNGAAQTNQRYMDAKNAARSDARALVNSDTDRELTKSDLQQLIRDELERKGFSVPNERNLWQWLKAEPSLIPAYMASPGRPKKN